jgi:hypothetical protein
MNRKQLIDEDFKRPDVPIDSDRLNREVDIGVALAHMADTRGWKLLIESYIAPKLDPNRFLTAPKEDLGEVRAAIKELSDLINYVDNQIKSGVKAWDRLHNKKEE